MRQEITEARTARVDPPLASDQPLPCQQCPVKQSIIDQLREQVAKLDDDVKQAQLDKLAQQDLATKADTELQRERANVAAAAQQIQEIRDQMARLEAQAAQDAAQQARLAAQAATDAALLTHREQARTADDDYHRKLREAEAGFDQRLAKTVAELNSEFDERIARQATEAKSHYEGRIAEMAADQQTRRQDLIEEIKVLEQERDELRARPSSSDTAELIELRAESRVLRA